MSYERDRLVKRVEATQEALDAYDRAHAGGSIPCAGCGRVFAKGFGLRVHQRTCTGGGRMALEWREVDTGVAGDVIARKRGWRLLAGPDVRPSHEGWSWWVQDEDGAVRTHGEAATQDAAKAAAEAWFRTHGPGGTS